MTASTNHPAANDIAPGSNKATLTLSDGSTIVLDTTQNGILTRQGLTTIQKLADGRLHYQATASASTSAPLTYNTVTTPIGGQYQVTLPDRSVVWLNAGSSIRFPTAFTGNERNVEISGEAYFEVAKNARQPFRVKTNDTYVTVLGTQFNIMAYKDEPAIKTTLVEGSVKVSRDKQSLLLHPGEQARIGNLLSLAPDANIEEAIAWKNGLFEFNSADIETVMRSLARWYNVDIKVPAHLNQQNLTALISRESPINEVLRILTASGYHFKIEGRTINILP